ncbi:MAG: sugar ABC transporter substrate-binding protein [Candidatus Hydrogenedentes bacterium]|nr:sugar ABC transporter substrate-binding protein [Candidatus Hydrogenedentota bacterium]
MHPVAKRSADQGSPCRQHPLVRLALLLALLLVGPSVVGANAPESPFRIGVLYWSMNIPGQVAMRQGLEAEAEAINHRAKANGARGVELLARVAGEGNEGIENQIVQMSALVMEGVDLLIVQPTDNAALVPPLKAANSAGIPVIAYDQYISDGVLASYLTSDNYQAGYLDGEYIAHHFPDDRAIRLVLVEYPHVSSTVERVNGLLDALQDRRQRYEILKTYIAVEPEGGRAAGGAILADFPEKGGVDVVFAVNDGGGMAVAEVLSEAGRSEIFMATIDGDPRSVERIAKGEGLIRIDSAQFCGPLGAEAMKTAYRVLNGEKVAPHILIPVFPVTAETVANYRGWMGPIPGQFTKPWPSTLAEWKPEPKAANDSDTPEAP